MNDRKSLKEKKVNPYDKRKVINSKKAIAKTHMTVKRVAMDTNKTRRKNTIKPLANSIAKKSAASRAKNEPVRRMK